MTTGLVGCFHGGDDNNPQPCHPRCPVQQWPRTLFRFSLLRNKWVLRKQYRHLVEEHQRWMRGFRIYADQFPDGRYHGPGQPRSLDEILARGA